MATPRNKRRGRAEKSIPGALRLVWNPKQSRFLKSICKYLNLEGGVRAGKSLALCFKVLYYCLRHPGIHCALTRWTQDGLDAQLRPIWRSVCNMAGIELRWHPDEEYDEVVATGSIVYLRALKASEETQRYSKLAGLTLAVLGIDQAEEVPEDVYRHYVPARLSQPGFPHQVIVTPNPPAEDSWIAKDWPEDNRDPSHEYIHTTLYDNAVILGQDYVATMESAYKKGSFEFRRLVQGKRGLMVAGVAIFGRSFDERRHVPEVPVEFSPYLTLYESWDFGTLHPCVTWCQFTGFGQLVALGGIMGIDLNLEQFAPLVEEYRGLWFPGLAAHMLQQTCDPAGDVSNSQGTQTGVTLLQTFGVYPYVVDNANYPPVKAAAIEVTVGYLSRSLPDGSPCFLMNPRFVIVSADERTERPILKNAFAAGYVYDSKRNYIGTTYPHLRPPKKDGFYEHPADSFLYSVTAFAPQDAAALAGLVRNPVAERQARKALELAGFPDASDVDITKMATQVLQSRVQNQQEKAALKALRRAQRDDGEPFRGGSSGARSSGRGGY